jgi:uncharacterized LabA/DUF88 family protein
LSKNVAVFVDVANIFYAAKAAGVDIDYVTLLKSAGAGRDLVRAYAYTGLDPDNENQRNFHDFLRRHGYKVVSKDIRKYGDGKVKANLDIELVVDMMKTSRNLDIAIVVSGDGDFAPAIRAVQEMGVRVEVISFRGNTSSDLIDVADQFTDITQLARVEKGSRSGRRVAGDDADLSMTEVPDKQTEGTGIGRGGRTTRGRGRGRAGEAETTVAASSARGRGRRPAAASTNGSGGDGLTAMPGERLSKAGGPSESELAAAEVFTLDDLDSVGAEGAATAEGEGETFDDAGRRRRRRGGRGRGRGRGREEAAGAPAPASAERTPAASRFEPADDEDDEPIETPRPPRSTPFGSVWDSQLGTAAPPAANLSPLGDDEDFEEPEIPEYLIAEQRRGARGGVRGQGGGRGGPRGGRAAYQSAIERERYGRGRSGGINRYPDVSGRGTDRGQRGGRGFEGQEQRPRDATRPSGSAEPWSEVPPELEAMLRAQVGQRPPTRPAETVGGRAAPELEAIAEVDVPPTAADDAEGVTQKPAPKRRTTRASTAKARTTKATAGAADEAAAPKRRTTRKATTASADDAGATAAPKRRTARKTSSAGADAETGSASDDGAGSQTDDEAPPKRRTTRRTTAKPAS